MAGTPISFAVLNGEKHLVNGQHTLSAIIRAETPQLLTVTEHQVETEREIAELYFRHDNHLTRSISDAFRALDLVSQTGLTFTEQGKLGAAAGFIDGGFAGMSSQKRISRDELANAVTNLAIPAKKYFEIIVGCRESLYTALTRRSTLSIGLICFVYSPLIAPDFWRQVALCDGLKVGDPRKTIHEFLSDVRTPGGGMKSRIASVGHHSRAIAAAWNAFIENRPLKQIKIIDDSAPIKLTGTPYSGNKDAEPSLDDVMKSASIMKA